MMWSNQAHSQIIEPSSKMESDYELTPKENIEFAERTIRTSTSHIEQLKHDLFTFYMESSRRAHQGKSIEDLPLLSNIPYVQLMRGNISFHESLVRCAHEDIAIAKEQLGQE